MTEPLAYLNGRLLPFRDATLSPLDAGFVFGATVTDFCRTFQQRLYLWPEHLGRLRHDADTCDIPLTATDAELTAAAAELVAHNAALLPAGVELALITFATPGPLGHMAWPPAAPSSGTVGMHTFPLPRERYRRFFAEGVALALTGPLPPDVAPTVKHRSRLRWWLADHAVRREGWPVGTLALPLDPDGQPTETAVGSLLAVGADGVVRSPRRDRVLDGISLRTVERLCRQEGIPIADDGLSLAQLLAASEAMLAGTAFCLAGVRRVGDTELPWPGPVFRHLLAAWGVEVRADIAGEFLSGQ
jgi:branched-chain amino acid aminotransferase